MLASLFGRRILIVEIGKKIYRRRLEKKMPRFVVHEHFASHHHWDLRLELDGALMSWAVPKEPPLKSGIRRLCILVAPHDLSYIDFKGTIEQGYGKNLLGCHVLNGTCKWTIRSKVSKSAMIRI